MTKPDMEEPGKDATEVAATSPRKPPRPTYAPFMLALGITMIFWGIATSPVMSLCGFGVFAWALWMWIRDLAQAWKD
jgi:hypothetical protein